MVQNLILECEVVEIKNGKKEIKIKDAIMKEKGEGWKQIARPSLMDIDGNKALVRVSLEKEE